MQVYIDKCVLSIKCGLVRNLTINCMTDFNQFWTNLYFERWIDKYIFKLFWDFPINFKLNFSTKYFCYWIFTFLATIFVEYLLFYQIFLLNKYFTKIFDTFGKYFS